VNQHTGNAQHADNSLPTSPAHSHYLAAGDTFLRNTPNGEAIAGWKYITWPCPDRQNIDAASSALNDYLQDHLDQQLADQM
jgi:hypothetical protein